MLKLYEYMRSDNGYKCFFFVVPSLCYLFSFFRVDLSQRLLLHSVCVWLGRTFVSVSVESDRAVSTVYTEMMERWLLGKWWGERWGAAFGSYLIIHLHTRTCWMRERRWMLKSSVEPSADECLDDAENYVRRAVKAGEKLQCWPTAPEIICWPSIQCDQTSD